MTIVRSIFGPEIEVGQGAVPNVQKRRPKTAELIGVVYRGTNLSSDPLVDLYYLGTSPSKQQWVLWCDEPHFFNDKCRNSNDKILSFALCHLSFLEYGSSYSYYIRPFLDSNLEVLRHPHREVFHLNIRDRFALYAFKNFA